MGKTAMVRARITPELKGAAEAVLAELGLSTTDAITMLYTQIALRRRLPDALASADAPRRITPMNGHDLLSKLPAGLWRNRTDIADSATFARELRAKAEHRQTRA